MRLFNFVDFVDRDDESKKAFLKPYLTNYLSTLFQNIIFKLNETCSVNHLNISDQDSFNSWINSLVEKAANGKGKAPMHCIKSNANTVLLHILISPQHLKFELPKCKPSALLLLALPISVETCINCDLTFVCPTSTIP